MLRMYMHEETIARNGGHQKCMLHKVGGGGEHTETPRNRTKVRQATTTFCRCLCVVSYVFFACFRLVCLVSGQHTKMEQEGLKSSLSSIMHHSVLRFMLFVFHSLHCVCKHVMLANHVLWLFGKCRSTSDRHFQSNSRNAIPKDDIYTLFTNTNNNTESLS